MLAACAVAPQRREDHDALPLPHEADAYLDIAWFAEPLTPSRVVQAALANHPDVRAELAHLCARRGLQFKLEETMRASAAPSDAAWQQRWERAVDALGVPLHRLPSGAGHDAMKLHEVMPQAMLFVRGQNAGISHNPLESTTSDDMELAVLAFSGLLAQLALELKPQP